MSSAIYQNAEGFRLSPQQAHIWNVQSEKSGAGSAVQCAVRIAGLVQTPRLQEAIKHVIDRYEILRTIFVMLSGNSVPAQVVHPSVDAPFVVVDCRAESPSSQGGEIGAPAGEYFKSSPEITPVAPLSFALELWPDGQAVFIVTASALSADSFTIVNVVHEIYKIYQGEDDPEGEVIQYADLAEWENQLLESPQEESRYWETAEFRELTFPHLPFELRRAQGTFAGYAGLTKRVSEATGAKIHELAERFGAPAATIFLAAFQIVLHGFSGLNRFLIGVGLSRRVEPELANVMGPLSRSVPLSARLEPATELRVIIEDLQTALAIATYDQDQFDWQSSPAFIGEPNRVNVPILFSNLDIPGLGKGDAACSWDIVAVRERLEDFGLALNAHTKRGSISLDWTWNTSMFAASDVDLFARAYMSVLDHIAEYPDWRVGDLLPCLGPERETQLYAERELDNHAFVPAHKLIELQARRVPARTAIVGEGCRTLSYQQMDSEASALCGELNAIGVGTDSVVAIVARRSPDFVVAILAVLKAGAAWLPIELDSPTERVAYMIRQSRAVAILAEPRAADKLQSINIPILMLERGGKHVSQDQMTAALTDQRQLAYVIFTSGSTGEPKGVAIEHRQLAAYLEGLSREQQFPDGAKFALVSTFSADLGHTALLAALSSGGSLHIIPSELSTDIPALATYFIETPVDFVKIAPAHLEAVCHEIPEAHELPWRAVLVGGEPLGWNLIKAVRRIAPGCAVFNEYGPTETTVGVVCQAAGDDDLFDSADAPIGRPRAGVNAYVLDEKLRPAPTWISGDLYVGGATVGRGYLGESRFTAERFIPDPFASTPGARMYSTGDVARLRSDGLLEFQGRRDRQVKIRGHRVELGEIEVALCRHPGVRTAVAVAVGEGSGRRLAAWVVVDKAQVRSGDVRTFLEQILPHHMVPSHIVCVDRLNVTANGKVDYRALPPIDSEHSRADLTSPVDDIEENLLAVWREVLGLVTVDVNDNYFSLGGDSLRVTQLVHGARKYGIDISAGDVLRHQTIRKLRIAMRSRSRQELLSSTIAPAPHATLQRSDKMTAETVDLYPATAMQIFVLDQYARNQSKQAVFHIQDCFRIRDEGFSIRALETAFAAAVQRHPALRTAFDLGGAPKMQLVRRNIDLKLTVKDIRGLDAAAQDSYVSQFLSNDRADRFDAGDPDQALFRVAVLVRSENEFHLVFSCHHAIMDGWGHRMLLSQLADTYGRVKSGSEVSLGSPDAACKELALYLDQVSRSENAADFWKKYLKGAELSKPRLSQSVTACEVDAPIVHELDPGLVRSLTNVGRREALGMQALLLSAWLETLRRWSQQESVITGVVMNGRSEHLTDPLSAVGLFWNILPLVSRQARTLRDLGIEVQKDLINMHPYVGFPLSRILGDFGADEIFNTTFRYVNFWNTQPLDRVGGFQILGGQGYDLYPFPVNCLLAINSGDPGGYLKVEYLADRVAPEDAAWIAAEHCRILREIVDAAP